MLCSEGGEAWLSLQRIAGQAALGSRADYVKEGMECLSISDPLPSGRECWRPQAFPGLVTAGEF